MEQTAIEQTIQDVRYGWRSFVRTPGFTIVVIVTLALGIGANSSIFSVIQAVLLRPLPYQHPAQLVVIWDRVIHQADLPKAVDAYTDLQAYQAGSHGFDQLAGIMWAADSKILSGKGMAKDVMAIPVTVNFFSLLGVHPARGRTFGQEDLRKGCALVLADKFWKSTLRGASDIVGQSLRLDGESCEVVGVMPESFAFLPNTAEMWQVITPESEFERDPNHHGIMILARLRPGASLDAIQAELRRLHTQAHLTDRHGRGTEPVIYSLQDEFTWTSGRNLRLSLLVLFATVGAVLLIACFNVANLLLGRSLARQRELAVRTALGSSRARLLRQLLTESLLLASAAAAAGTGLAIIAVHFFRVTNPVQMPPGTPVEVNSAVLAFTCLLAVITTVVFGFVPAWRASQADLNEVLKSGTRNGAGDPAKHRLGNALVVMEVMLSLVLLATAGLLIQSVTRYSSAPLGFATDRLVTMTLSLSPQSYARPEQRIQFYNRLMNRLEERPGLKDSALSSDVPLLRGTGMGILSIDGKPEPENARLDTSEHFVTPGYFRMLSVPLESGRDFTEADRDSAEQVAIVNEALAREYFPGTDPIGRHIRFRGMQVESLTVVGVTRNERQASAFNEMSWSDEPTIYRPFGQHPSTMAFLLTRTGASAKAAENMVRKQLAAIDPGVAVHDAETMQQMIARFATFPRFRAVLLSVFAALALLLAVVGLYGVLSQSVAQRTRDIGVRVALGASRADVLQLVFRQGFALIAIGLGLGWLATWGVTRFFRNLLYGVDGTDPLMLMTVSIVLAAAALVAMYLPARRASRVEPVVALRYE